MPKNKTGGRNHRKQASKHAQPSGGGHVRLPRDKAEMIAKVIKLCGQGRADVQCTDGVTRLLEIRKKFRGRNKRDNMIAMDTLVLVGLRDWEVRSANKKPKVDLLYVYSMGQHETLTKDEDVLYLMTGKRGDDMNAEGFQITNTATWKQKMEDGDVAEEEDESINKKVESSIGMNPLEDADFNWDDI